MYEDTRKTEEDAAREAKEKDLMDEWDDAKLAEVVASKQDVANKNLPTGECTHRTDSVCLLTRFFCSLEIICKYFLDALENHSYGWFWQCQNGKTCKYRHALPVGYVLVRFWRNF